MNIKDITVLYAIWGKGPFAQSLRDGFFALVGQGVLYAIGVGWIVMVACWPILFVPSILLCGFWIWYSMRAVELKASAELAARAEEWEETQRRLQAEYEDRERRAALYDQ